MRTTSLALAFALAAGGFTTVTFATANAAIKNRAECYTAVTNACNKKKSSEAISACNDSGHSQCDKQFPNASVDPMTPTNFRATTTMKQN